VVFPNTHATEPFWLETCVHRDQKAFMTAMLWFPSRPSAICDIPPFLLQMQ
jgi:hypothetical protein